jgi:hypothetical protein
MNPGDVDMSERRREEARKNRWSRVRLFSACSMMLLIQVDISSMRKGTSSVGAPL